MHQGERHVEQYISWNFEEFTGFLLSKENCIMVGFKKHYLRWMYDHKLYVDWISYIAVVFHFQDAEQDNMSQPLSRYWINSSVKTQVRL